MAPENLDEIDQGILFLLQEDARNVTVEEIGEQVGVAPSTVATRITNLEGSGVITGYTPTIDYFKAGFDQRLLLVGTAPLSDIDELVEEAIRIRGVLRVREFSKDEENVSIELVGESQQKIEERIEELNDLGITVTRTEVLKRETSKTFDSFGQEFVG